VGGWLGRLMVGLCGLVGWVGWWLFWCGLVDWVGWWLVCEGWLVG